MKRYSQHILFVFLPLIFFLVFFIDLIFLYSQIVITPLRLFREALLIGLLIGSWYLVQNHFRTEKLSIPQKLGRLTILLTLNYLLVLVLGAILHPVYSDTFPPEYQNVSAVLFASLLGVVAPPTLLAVLKIIRDLIFYRQKPTTRLFFQLFLLFTALTSLSLYLTRQPLNFSFQGLSALNSLLFLATLFFIVALSFRNDWIVYLPRKTKWLYFGVGLLLLSEIYSLFDVVYKTHLSAYSLLIASFSFILYVFLMVYATVAVLKISIYLPTAKAFDRKIREVNSLYNLARTLNSELQPEKLTRLITRLTREVLQCDAVWLELYDAERNRFQVAHAENVPVELVNHHPFHQNPSFLREVYGHRRSLLVPDLHHHREYDSIRSWKRDARSLLAVPLLSNRNQLMGVLFSLSRTAYAFDSEDLSLLEGFANQAAIALENAELLKQSLARERVEQELKVAREVQLKLLPQQEPRIPGLEVAALSLAAYEVGGDYYDFFTFRDGAPGFVIGDVSGKGTSAAFYVAEFKGVIQTLARLEVDPLAMACQANRILFPNIERKAFISGIIGRYEADQHCFSFVRAGHTPVYHWQQACQQLASLQPPGLAFGLDRGELFEKTVRLHQVPLGKGDFLLLYTDGLTEVRNQLGEEFGDDRLEELLQKCAARNAEQIKEFLFDQITGFLQRQPLLDDLTFIIVRSQKEPQTRTTVPGKKSREVTLNEESVMAKQ